MGDLIKICFDAMSRKNGRNGKDVMQKQFFVTNGMWLKTGKRLSDTYDLKKGFRVGFVEGTADVKEKASGHKVYCIDS